MGETLLTIYVFLQKWLVPFLFAIGLIFFVYGFIVYYIIGHQSGDEDRMDHGRHNLLKAFVFLSLALLIYFLVFAVGWFGNYILETSGSAGGGGSIDGGADVNREQDLLKVPDVPRREE